MIEQQQKLVLSPYMEIYELVVPKDNLLRQIKELVDFEFIYDELLDKYCLDNGRNAVPPIRMFKYLLLKAIYDLSDVDVVERSKYDMSFKYFLNMAPEETVINPSSLTKFRKLRLKDMNLLDMLISKTVQIALDKKIIKSKSIIVDATHTKSRYNQKTPRQALQEQSKNLRRTVYEVDETMKEKFPNKNTEDSLEKELEYCKQLLSIVKDNEDVCSYPKVQEKLLWGFCVTQQTGKLFRPSVPCFPFRLTVIASVATTGWFIRYSSSLCFKLILSLGIQQNRHIKHSIFPFKPCIAVISCGDVFD